MELIANIGAWLLTAFMGFVGSVLANDACKSADRVCTKIIHRASQKLAKQDQIPKLDEWLADLSERDTTFDKYHHSLGCFFAAGPMRRRAEQVTIAVEVGAANFGNFPLRFDFKTLIRAVKFVALFKTHKWFKISLRCVLLYIYFRALLSAHRVNPKAVGDLVGQFAGLRAWRYKVSLETRDLVLDVNGLVDLVGRYSNGKSSEELNTEMKKFLTRCMRLPNGLA